MRLFSVSPAYEARGKLIHDAAQTVTFFKVVPSVSVPKFRPAVLAPFDRVREVAEVVSFDKDGGIVFSRVRAILGKGRAGEPISSEEGTGLIALNEKAAPGTLVFDQYGTLLGIADKTGNLTPAELILSALRQYLAQGEARATRFGVHFIDLSGIAVTRANLPAAGLLLTGAKGRPAVLTASPAQKAGLREGDGLTSLDGRRFDGSLPLAVILAQYRPGVEVEVEFLRQGETQKVKVALDAK